MIIRFILFFILFFIFKSHQWILVKFGEINIYALAFHMQYGKETVMYTDRYLVMSGIKQMLILPIIYSGFVVLIHHFLLTKFKSLFERYFALRMLVSKWVPVLLVLCMVKFVSKDIEIKSFLMSKFGPKSTFFNTSYVYPETVKITPRDPQNLVLIYFESLERTYHNEKLFGKDLLTAFTPWEEKNIYFPRVVGVPLTNWTIAGQLASMCGLPLQTHMRPAKVLERTNTFLSSAICLPDILAAQGYKNVFIKAANLKFAGTDKFAQSHSYHEMLGGEHWKKAITNRELFGPWGIYDVELFEQMKVELQKLRSENKKFFLTITTLDTHGPTGFLSKHCREKGYNDFAGVVQCNTAVVASFLDWMSKEGFFKNTRVMITGDHMSNENPISNALRRSNKRSIYNLFIPLDSEPRPKNITTNPVVMFDMFPTLLTFAGFDIEGNRLGLGTNMFSDLSVKRSRKDVAYMSDNVPLASDLYNSLWKSREPAKPIAIVTRPQVPIIKN